MRQSALFRGKNKLPREVSKFSAKYISHHLHPVSYTGIMKSTPYSFANTAGVSTVALPSCYPDVN